MWRVGDVCFVDGEGDEVFVISEISAGSVELFGHGREPIDKLQRLTLSMLEQARDDLLARLALLQVQATQVGAAIVSALRKAP